MEKPDIMLKFSKENSKLVNIMSLSLSSGWSCPFANECYSKADPATGKISDGPDTKFRCFSASQESLYPAVRNQRLHNFNLLKNVKTVEELVQIIQQSLPKVNRKGLGRIIRIHVAGDFFNQKYFDAWLTVAKNNPDRIFYAYTKSLQYWVNRISEIPTNFKLNASRGGKLDHLIKDYNLKYAEVVFSEQEAIDKGLEIDHDDSHAYDYNHSFALLLHGTQPKGSKAAVAKSLLAKQGWTGYQKKKGRNKVIN